MNDRSQYAHGHAYDLFVSHSSRDLEWVRPFHDDLVKEVNRWTDPDIHPFLDRISIAPGDVWNPEEFSVSNEIRDLGASYCFTRTTVIGGQRLPVNKDLAL